MEGLNINVKVGLIDNVVYVAIKEDKMYLMKQLEDKIENGIYSLDDKVNIIKFIGGYNVICHSSYIFRMYMKNIYNKEILDSKELSAILEPYYREYDIEYLLSKVTTFSDEELCKLKPQNKVFYLVNSMLCREWSRKGNRIYEDLNEAYKLKDKWIWMKYLKKPLFFDGQGLEFVCYKEKKEKEIKVYDGDIKYSDFEKLLRQAEIWNVDKNNFYEYRCEQEKFSAKIRENIEDEGRIFIEAPDRKSVV